MTNLSTSYSVNKLQNNRKRKIFEKPSNNNSLYQKFFRDSLGSRVSSPKIFNSYLANTTLQPKGSTVNKIFHKEERKLYFDLLQRFQVDGFTTSTPAPFKPIKSPTVPQTSCLSHYKKAVYRSSVDVFNNCGKKNWLMGGIYSKYSSRSSSPVSDDTKRRLAGELAATSVPTPAPSNLKYRNGNGHSENSESGDDCVLVNVESEGQRTSSDRPAFKDLLAASPYHSTEYLTDMRSRVETRKQETDRKIAAAEESLKVHNELKKNWEDDMVDRMREGVKIRERLPPLKPYLFVAPPMIEEPSEEEKEFPELDDDAEAQVTAALGRGDPDEILSNAFRLQVTRREMATLGGLNWLSDMIINFYMQMIVQRSTESTDKKLPKVYAFTTFFYPKVKSSGYDSVKRWTRRDDILSCDLLLIPIHLGMHWCLACADIQAKKLTYYDSMGSSNSQCLSVLLNYLECESKNRKGQSLPPEDWTLESSADSDHFIPQQENGSDCGMFACKFAEFLSRRQPFCFEQRHMPYYRRRMVYEILQQKLMS